MNPETKQSQFWRSLLAMGLWLAAACAVMMALPIIGLWELCGKIIAWSHKHNL